MRLVPAERGGAAAFSFFQPLLSCLCAVRDGVVSRECGPDGQWVTNASSSTWRDPSQCRDQGEPKVRTHAHARTLWGEALQSGWNTDVTTPTLAFGFHLMQERRMLILAYFRVTCTVGYCVSLSSLCLALIILLFFRWANIWAVCLPRLYLTVL